MKKTNKIIFPIIILVVLIGLSLILVIRSVDKSSTHQPTFPGNTLIIAAEGDFAFKNTTNEFSTHFKAKATEPESIVFANNLGNISFYTPKKQSFGELNSDTPPVSTGSTLTYHNIFAQTDLRYIISSSRLLEEFIIKDKATANKVTRIEQRAKTDLKYEEKDNGSIVFTQNGKTSFTLPPPVLYELGNKNNRSEGIRYEIKKENNQLIITKVITSQGLTWINDPNRQYPIVIDLVIDNADTSANWVSSDTTNTVVSQETTLKQEGTGSVKVQTTSQSASAIDFMEYSSDANAQEAYVTNSFFAYGGTVTTTGGYRIHTFTADDTLTITGSGNVEVLAVAGGGGGAGGALVHGGGGGGGMVSNSSVAVSSGDISVTVGSGGTAGSGGAAGGTCGDSIFSTVTAYGGGGGQIPTNNGNTGGNGGGAASWLGGAVSGGTGTQGYNGGGVAAAGGLSCAGGGGGGAGAVGATGGVIDNWQAGAGGIGANSSISGASVCYAGGGGGSGRGGEHAVGGGCGGGNGGSSAGTNGLGGGGGGGSQSATGYAGGSGVVIVRYPDPTALEVYSEPTIKTEGTFSLKGVAQATTSLNKTLTRTLSTKLNLSDLTTVTFDIRASRTGSNIKVGIHDSGGTTTEVTPNIASADTFQSATIDLSAVSNANKDDIDSIIVTILNADSSNTFYIDNLVYYGYADTVDLMEYSSDGNAQTAFVTNAVIASGGTETTSGVYRIHTFTSDGTLTVTTGGNVETLVVAGGGGGGNAGLTGNGGGGAGGLVYNSSFAISSGSPTVTIGGGGTPTNNGGNSVFSTITAYGGGAGGYNSDGFAGGCGGGGGAWNTTNYGGAGTQGYAGGDAVSAGVAYGGGGGGGMGAAGVGVWASNSWHGGAGGDGLAYSISGTSTYYSGGGGGASRDSIYVNGGLGGGGRGGGNGVSPTAGTANTGGGGGAGYSVGMNGGSGIVIVRYPDLTLQSYSEGTIKNQGAYSLKGVAKATNSLNQTLTRTIGSPINLSGADSVDFDIYAGRTGSNIKVGIHDTGGTTTEVTPNVTSANAWQTASLDLTGVSDANKDAIDKIIITIVNADADNTFYLDNMTYSHSSVGDTVTLTKAATDLSSINYIFFWVRSSVAGSFVRFQFGETVSTEQTYPITISNANTWEQKVWDISGISASARNAVTKFAFQTTSDTYEAAFYFDDLSGNSPPNTPSLDLPANTATNQITLPILKTTTTDADSDYLRYKILLCTNSGMTANCQTFDQTASQTGWSGQNTQTNTAYTSGTQAVYTVQTALSNGTTYYWKSQAIDPAGTNYWSSTQATPYSFTTVSLPATASNCRIAETLKDTSLTIIWADNATDEDYYEVQRSVDGGDFSVFATGLNVNAQAHTDSTITEGHTYQYKVAPYKTIGPTYGHWCTTSNLDLQLGTFSIKGLDLKGLELH